MRHFILILLLGLALAAGCSSNTPANDGGPNDATSEPFDICNSFTQVGDPCPHVSGTVCFPECTNGGCKCVAGSKGPVWECTTDTSCMPCAGPLDDGSADCGTDGEAGTVPDASDDAGDGSADAGDASADAGDAASE